jgi:hypothetical protein
VRVLKESYQGQGALLVSLFQKLLQSLPESEAAGGGLLELHCRDVGVWVRRKEAGQAPKYACVRLSHAAWSSDHDAIVRYMSTSAPEPLVVLERELGYRDGVPEAVTRFFTQTLGVTNEACRRRFLALLKQALVRWMETCHPTIPRDVEEMYRVLGTGVEQDPTSKGLEEVPFLKKDFKLATLPCLPEGAPVESTVALDQPLVGVVGVGQPGDSALHWFYREYFPTRCVHPAIFAVMREGSPSLMTRLRLAQPRDKFADHYADTEGSVSDLVPPQLGSARTDPTHCARRVAGLTPWRRW